MDCHHVNFDRAAAEVRRYSDLNMVGIYLADKGSSDQKGQAGGSDQKAQAGGSDQKAQAALKKTSAEAAEDDYYKHHKEPPIGDATMDKHKTIHLRLRRSGTANVDGTIEYKKESEYYKDVLEHLGGLKPGQVKLVPPFPDDFGKKKTEKKEETTPEKKQ